MPPNIPKKKKRQNADDNDDSLGLSLCYYREEMARDSDSQPRQQTVQHVCQDKFHRTDMSAQVI